MNKQEMIDYIASQCGMTKVDAGRALEAMMDGVKTTLMQDGKVSLVGFGTFQVGTRAASTGRNPRTGEEISIPTTKQPKFRPGKELKEAVNK